MIIFVSAAEDTRCSFRWREVNSKKKSSEMFWVIVSSEIRDDLRLHMRVVGVIMHHQWNIFTRNPTRSFGRRLNWIYLMDGFSKTVKGLLDSPKKSSHFSSSDPLSIFGWFFVFPFQLLFSKLITNFLSKTKQLREVSVHFKKCYKTFSIKTNFSSSNIWMIELIHWKILLWSRLIIGLAFTSERIGKALTSKLFIRDNKTYYSSFVDFHSTLSK